MSGQKVASAKVVVAEAAPSTSTAGGKSLPVASARPKTVASAVASVSKVTATVISPRVGVRLYHRRQRGNKRGLMLVLY
jgi:hypothetical protein